MKVFNNIVETIGNTPLVRLNKIGKGILKAEILLKVEYFNPGNSIKDRIGINMVEEAEKSGQLKPGGTIIECTSGNTGMGLALAAAVKGYKCIFTTTDKQSKEKVDILRALGAEVIVCPTNVNHDDPRNYHQVAERLLHEIPGAVFVNQYENLSNRDAHYKTTGPEIWEQTDGKITHYVTTIGTGGTVTGTSMYLKEKNPAIRTLGVDAYGSILKKYKETGEIDMTQAYPYLIEGIGQDIVPGNFDFKYIDFVEQVSDKDAALMCRRLAREEGIFVGFSGGAVVQGLLQMKDQFKEGDVVVVILHDHGSRYINKIFNDDWMRDRGFLKDEPITAKAIVERKQIKELVSASPVDTVADAFKKMKELALTQLPVIENGKDVGSITENRILHLLMENPYYRDTELSKVMGAPFPYVGLNHTAAEISKLISKENSAVLVKTNMGETSIITEFDLIEAMA
jgi:cystathionine beta-synthase